jgi:hypothetical protein
MVGMTKNVMNPEQAERGVASNRCTAIVRSAACSMFCILVSPSHFASAAYDAPQPPGSAKRMVATVMANEDLAALHRDHYAYLSKERSDRTGGHLWTEKVVETNVGKIRMLLEQDDQPLSADRITQERGRLAAIVADPAAFTKKSQATKDDEAHARQMLQLAPRAFLFSDPREDGEFLRIDFKPDPAYETQSMEERVLHAMSGTMLIDPKMMRLHQINGRLPQDVSIGFGLLATIRAGSSFATTRDRLGEPDFKTTMLDTDINGKAIFFKSIAKKEHAEHANFVRVPNDLSVTQAVAIAEQP